MGSKSTNNNKPNITKTDGHLIKYFSDTFSAGSHAGHPSNVEPQGIDATGGFISVYEDPTTSGVYYKSHTFTGSGTFTVNSLNDGPNQIEYVVVGAGGGGGGYCITSTISPNYHVGTKGNPTSFDNGGPSPVQSFGGGGGGVYTRPITASGNTGDFGPIAPGGCGGGGCAQSSGSVDNDEDGGTGTPLQGYPGGRGYFSPGNMWRGAGGGGAGGAGENGGPQSTQGWSLPANNGVGGDGVYTRIINGALTGLAGGGSCGGRRAAEGAGLENSRNPNGTFGGGYGGADIRGGDASAHSGSGGGGGDGGGGAGSAGGGAGGYRSSVVGESSGGGGPAESKFTIAAGTSYNIIIGGGGSGSFGYNTPSTHLQPLADSNTPTDYSGGGGNGASGIVAVRYPVPSLTSNNSYKASGGQVYQWVAPNASAIGNGNESITVHVFTGAGSFVTPESFNETVEYLIIGGGGGGGVGGSNEAGGGGGAGGFLTGTMPLVGSQNLTINVGGGGLGGTPTVTATDGGYSAVGSALTAWGGGRGGSGFNQTDSGAATGGSAGGGGYNPNPGVAVNAIDPTQGNSGGRYDSPSVMGGGGGGAGGAGVPGNAAANSGSHGGLGKQFPITFQNPNAMDFAMGYPGPGGTGFWVAGGGAGGAYNLPYMNLNCRGAGPGGPFAGAGDGGHSAGPGNPLQVSNCTPGRRYSGSGGGGGVYQLPGMTGGSGIVLIAYRT